jgi:hypothetical protein
MPLNLTYLKSNGIYLNYCIYLNYWIYLVYDWNVAQTVHKKGVTTLIFILVYIIMLAHQYVLCIKVFDVLYTVIYIFRSNIFLNLTYFKSNRTTVYRLCGQYNDYILLR